MKRQKNAKKPSFLKVFERPNEKDNQALLDHSSTSLFTSLAEANEFAATSGSSGLGTAHGHIEEEQEEDLFQQFSYDDNGEPGLINFATEFGGTDWPQPENEIKQERTTNFSADEHTMTRSYRSDSFAASSPVSQGNQRARSGDTLDLSKVPGLKHTVDKDGDQSHWGEMTVMTLNHPTGRGDINVDNSMKLPDTLVKRAQVASRQSSTKGKSKLFGSLRGKSKKEELEVEQKDYAGLRASVSKISAGQSAQAFAQLTLEEIDPGSGLIEAPEMSQHHDSATEASDNEEFPEKASEVISGEMRALKAMGLSSSLNGKTKQEKVSGERRALIALGIIPAPKAENTAVSGELRALKAMGISSSSHEHAHAHPTGRRSSVNSIDLTATVHGTSGASRRVRPSLSSSRGEDKESYAISDPQPQEPRRSRRRASASSGDSFSVERHRIMLGEESIKVDDGVVGGKGTASKTTCTETESGAGKDAAERARTRRPKDDGKSSRRVRQASGTSTANGTKQLHKIVQSRSSTEKTRESSKDKDNLGRNVRREHERSNRREHGSSTSLDREPARSPKNDRRVKSKSDDESLRIKNEEIMSNQSFTENTPLSDRRKVSATLTIEPATPNAFLTVDEAKSAFTPDQPRNGKLGFHEDKSRKVPDTAPGRSSNLTKSLSSRFVTNSTCNDSAKSATIQRDQHRTTDSFSLKSLDDDHSPSREGDANIETISNPSKDDVYTGEVELGTALVESKSSLTSNPPKENHSLVSSESLISHKTSAPPRVDESELSADIVSPDSKKASRGLKKGSSSRVLQRRGMSPQPNGVAEFSWQRNPPSRAVVQAARAQAARQAKEELSAGSKRLKSTPRSAISLPTTKTPGGRRRRLGRGDSKTNVAADTNGLQNISEKLGLTYAASTTESDAKESINEVQLESSTNEESSSLAHQVPLPKPVGMWTEEKADLITQEAQEPEMIKEEPITKSMMLLKSLDAFYDDSDIMPALIKGEYQNVSRELTESKNRRQSTLRENCRIEDEIAALATKVVELEKKLSNGA
jgi:hypothetical protein